MLFHKKEIEAQNILKDIYGKGRLKRYLLFGFGLLLTAFAFNIFLLPSQIVYGVSGIAVMTKHLWGISPSLIILVGSILLLILSVILLGIDKTKNSIVGSLLYPLFVEMTVQVTKYIDLGATEPVVIAVFGAVISGFGLGMIFKSGFTTGGTDILNQIVSKYFKMSVGNAMFFTDGVIILCSLFVFGWQKFIYSVIAIYLISIMTDKVILGISQAKAFYIITSHETDVKKFILSYLSHGVTVLEARGGYTGNHQKVILCVIPTKEYFIAKEGIQKIDPEAVLLVTDAYEVAGIA